jgi:hypothetical protein
MCESFELILGVEEICLLGCAPCTYHRSLRHKQCNVVGKHLPDLCIAASSNSWRPMQGFNAGPCFFVCDQELRTGSRLTCGSRIS